MKKFFLFVAAVAAAMTVNAAVWDFSNAPGEFTPGNGSDAVTISDADAALVISAMTSAHAADAFGTVDGFDGLGFYYKNSGGSSKAGFKFFPDKKILQLCGGDVTLLILDLNAGDKIKVKFITKGDKTINATELMDGKGTAALDEIFPKNIKIVTDASSSDKNGDPVVAEFEVLSDGVAALKSKNGYNILAISVNEDLPQGIEDVVATGKAVKVFENGQLVIIKNGVRYNALGAAL